MRGIKMKKVIGFALTAVGIVMVLFAVLPFKEYLSDISFTAAGGFSVSHISSVSISDFISDIIVGLLFMVVGIVMVIRSRRY